MPGLRNRLQNSCALWLAFHWSCIAKDQRPWCQRLEKTTATITMPRSTSRLCDQAAEAIRCAHDKKTTEVDKKLFLARPAREVARCAVEQSCKESVCPKCFSSRPFCSTKKASYYQC
eukprot:2102104-Amphidinium_carterae.1